MICKKVLCYCLSVAMLITLCGGCAQKTDESSDMAGNDSQTTEGNVGEPTEITICLYGQAMDNYISENDPIRILIEEKTNTRLKFVSYPDNTYIEDITAALEAGNGADLIQNWGSKGETGTWADQGWLVDLYPLVREDTDRYPILNSIMEDPVYKLYNEMYTGDAEKAYGFYTLFGSSIYNHYVGDLVYNMKILKEAGFDEPPKTLEEFMDYGRAAAAKGYIAWYPRNWNLEAFHNMNYSVLSQFDTAIEYPDGNLWTGLRQDEAGVWSCVTTSNASQEGIKVLHQMYEEGILPAEIGSLPDFDTTIEKWANDEIGCISYLCSNPYQYQWALEEYQVNHPEATFEDIRLGSLFKAADGTIGKQDYVSFYVAANWVVPNTSEEKTAKILDLLNFIGTPEGQDLIFKGMEGTFYTEDADGNIAANKEEWANINQMLGINYDQFYYPFFCYVYSMAQMQGASWGGSNLWVNKSADLIDYTDETTGYSDSFLKARAVTDKIQSSVGRELPPYYVFIALSQDSLDIRTRLKEISLEYIPAFITGAKDIDAEWPAYIKAYEEAGVQQLADDFNAQVEVAKQKYESLTKFAFVLNPQ